jgi:hypothetical protein
MCDVQVTSKKGAKEQTCKELPLDVRNLSYLARNPKGKFLLWHSTVCDHAAILALKKEKKKSGKEEVSEDENATPVAKSKTKSKKRK